MVIDLSHSIWLLNIIMSDLSKQQQEGVVASYGMRTLSVYINWRWKEAVDAPHCKVVVVRPFPASSLIMASSARWHSDEAASFPP
jgi:hypothetical protein